MPTSLRNRLTFSLFSIKLDSSESELSIDELWDTRV